MEEPVLLLLSGNSRVPTVLLVNSVITWDMYILGPDKWSLMFHRIWKQMKEELHQGPATKQAWKKHKHRWATEKKMEV